MRQWVFCYGTLILPRLMATVLGRRAAGIPATLAGQRRVLLRGRDYPGLLAAAGQHIAGVLYAIHHRRELGRLDRYEGREYRRRRLPVHTSHGTLRAWVYLPRQRWRLGDRPWSADRFARRSQRQYLRRIPGWRRAPIADSVPPAA